jgi:putative transposase
MFHHQADDLSSIVRPQAVGRVAPELVPVGVAQEVAAAVENGENACMANNRQIVDDLTYAHYVTFSVYRRRRLLDHNQSKRIVLGGLNAVLIKREGTCIGFVIMPDHVHAIIWFGTTGKISGFMHDWKRETSYHLRNWYRDNAAHYIQDFGEGDKFWQPKYYDFVVYGQEKLLEKLTYMHENPVRAGLVTKAVDWQWSSLRWYLEGKTVGVPVSFIG